MDRFAAGVVAGAVSVSVAGAVGLAVWVTARGMWDDAARYLFTGDPVEDLFAAAGRGAGSALSAVGRLVSWPLPAWAALWMAVAAAVTVGWLAAWEGISSGIRRNKHG